MAKSARQLLNRLAVLAIIPGVLLLIALINPANSSPLVQAVLDAMHTPAFGTIALAVLWLCSPIKNWSKRISAALAVSVALAIASEVTQIPFERDASFTDLLANLVGIISFLLVALTLVPSSPIRKGVGRLLLIPAFALLLFPAWPLYKVSNAYWYQYEIFPKLVSSSGDFFNVFVKSINSTIHLPTDSGAPISVELNSPGYSGISIHDVWSDWRGYNVLVFVLRNNGEKILPVTIRVHDRSHLAGSQPQDDRFSKSVDLDIGQNRIEIPLSDIELAPVSRKIDLSNMHGIGIFTDNIGNDRTFELVTIYLSD